MASKLKPDIGSWTILIVIAVLIVGAGFFAYKYMIAEEIIDEPDVLFHGNVNFKVSETDALAGGSHTSTNVVFLYFVNEPTDDLGGLSITTTGTGIEIEPTQLGYCWISVDNGDDEYPISRWLEPTFKAQNPRIREIVWRDLTGDDKDEMLIKIWLGDLQVGVQDPIWTLKMPWVDEDVSGITTDNPSDQVSIGTGSGTEVTIKWDVSGCTAEDGFVLGKIYFTTNDTREGNDVRLTKLKMYGSMRVKGQTSWAAPTGMSAGDYEAYYFQPVDYTDPMDGILVYRDTDDADSLTIELTVKCYLETLDDIDVSIYLETVGGDGATAQVTDTVSLKEGSS
jgi:hypothetical protein